MGVFGQLKEVLSSLRAGVAWSALFAVLTVLSGVSLMGASGWLIATAASHPHIGVLQVAVVGVRTFGVSRGVMRYAERLRAHAVTLEAIAKLRGWVYTKLWPLAPVGLDQRRGGDLVRRLVSDVEAQEFFLLRVLLPLMTSMVVLVLTPAFLALVYLPSFGFILLIGHLLVVALAWGAFLSRRGRLGRVSALEGSLGAMAAEGIEAREELMLYGALTSFEARFDALVEEIGRARSARGMREIAIDAVATAVPYLTVFGGAMLGISVAQTGQIDGVDLTVILLIILASFEAVIALPSAALTLSDELASTARLDALLSQTPPLRPGREGWAKDASSPPALSLSEVESTYPGASAPVIRGASLAVEPGERVAIIGPSGGGKTTLLRLLQGYLGVQAGAASVDGQSVAHLSEDALRSRLGVLDQGSHLFTGTLSQNLRLAKPDASEAEISAALKAARLEELVEVLPDGMETWLGQEGRKLSGGEQRRLALARLFLRDTPALFFDEPTANLDAVTSKEVMEAIEEASRGKTTLLVTHRLIGLERFDRVLFVAEGRVLESGSHAALMARSPRYRDAVGPLLNLSGGGREQG